MPLRHLNHVRIRCKLGPDGFQKCKLLRQRQLADFSLSDHEGSMAVDVAMSNSVFHTAYGAEERQWVMAASREMSEDG